MFGFFNNCYGTVDLFPEVNVPSIFISVFLALIVVTVLSKPALANQAHIIVRVIFWTFFIFAVIYDIVTSYNGIKGYFFGPEIRPLPEIASFAVSKQELFALLASFILCICTVLFSTLDTDWTQGTKAFNATIMVFISILGSCLAVLQFFCGQFPDKCKQGMLENFATFLLEGDERPRCDNNSIKTIPFVPADLDREAVKFLHTLNHNSQRLCFRSEREKREACYWIWGASTFNKDRCFVSDDIEIKNNEVILSVVSRGYARYCEFRSVEKKTKI